MQVLAPYISCVCYPNEFNDAVAQGFKEIYIITVQGTFKHHILRGENRYVRTKVDKIPGYTEETYVPSMNFLPAGKIPFELYEQVLNFFRKVMEVKTSELEAMIHILWNPEQGYHIGVPPQTISKASVSYDWNYIPAGTNIIVDIHSHNTMGAFFSGTDNRDDSNNISYSGVFGKLKDKTPETVWRFNYMQQKFQAKLEDLFEAPPLVETKPVPAEWLERVTVQTYPGNGLPGNYHGAGAWDWKNQARNTNAPNTVNGVGVQRGFSGYPYDDEDYEAAWAGYDRSAARAVPVTRATPAVVRGLDGKPRQGNVHTFDPQAERAAAKQVDGAKVGTRYAPPVSPSIVIEDGDAAADAIVSEFYKNLGGGDAVPSAFPRREGYYENLALSEGPAVANAWMTINDEMIKLVGSDDVSRELVADMFELQEDSSQLETIAQLYHRLSPKNQEKLATQGF